MSKTSPLTRLMIFIALVCLIRLSSVPPPAIDGVKNNDVAQDNVLVLNHQHDHKQDKLGDQGISKQEAASSDAISTVAPLISSNTNKENIVTPSEVFVSSSGDSSSATVLGVATGYNVDVFKIFVGSLRRSGFLGHIILGVADDVSTDVLDYFKARNVTAKVLRKANCTFAPWYDGNKTILDQRKQEHIEDYESLTTCVHPYTNIKSRWVKYPLARDWLEECKTCTGPVLISDIRDVYFQADPFGPGSPKIEGLQVFEEHQNLTTDDWLVSWPADACKNTSFTKPMLCSGTTIGTREAMIDYLNAMYNEMKIWISTKECRLWTIADDQSIHNILFYAGKLANAVAIPLGHGIVNTVGVETALIFEEHVEKWAVQNITRWDGADYMQLEGATDRSWIGTKYRLTDEDGYFINKDGTRSHVIHQFDRTNVWSFQKWMEVHGLHDWHHDSP